AQSVAVIYISHYLNEVFEISDHIVVLRDGRNAGTFAPSAARSDVLGAMLGRVAGDLYERGAKGGAEGEDVLAVDGFSLPGRLVELSFSVRHGEVFGVFGLIGSGIETLGRALYGALGPSTAGTLRIAGSPYRPLSPRSGKSAGIGFVAADRKKEGIIGDLS